MSPTFENSSTIGDGVEITTVPVYYCDEYVCTDYSIDTRRKARDIAESLEKAPIRGVRVVAPEPATRREIERVHSRRYTAGILSGNPRDAANDNGIGKWSKTLSQSVAYSIGGVIEAVRTAIRTGSNAGSLSSGLHHARFDHGAGFCTINGLAVAARIAIDEGAQRVLILDFDAHCGGGTASLIEAVAGIEQVDVSVSSFDQYTSTSQAQLKLSTGATYLDDIRRALESIKNPGEIDVVLYNAGMDPYQKCSVGGVRGITAEVLRTREEMVFDWAKAAGVPVAFVLAGGYTGYDFTTDELVDLHRLTIAAAAGNR